VTPVAAIAPHPYDTESVNYTLISDLAGEVQIPENGILSRTLYSDDHVKILVFGFAPGQELSAHTAPMSASIYIHSGEARLTLGADTFDVQAGAFVHMPPQLPHGILAKTPVIMLLQMYQQAR
jgi:quercetin dioxygenase-like cupin family protein